MANKQQQFEELLYKKTGIKLDLSEAFVQPKKVETDPNRAPQHLRSASQMYQYCLDNDFGSGFNEKWSTKHFMLIEEDLHDDEYVLMCFIGMHNYSSLSNHDGYFAYAITNKRFIMAQQKVIGQVVQSVLLKNLNDITVESGAIMGIITIDTIKERFNVCTNKYSVNNIYETAHEILLTINQSNAQQQIQLQQISDADEILKYKNLLDMGIISQDEFDYKKKQLLGL